MNNQLRGKVMFGLAAALVASQSAFAATPISDQAGLMAMGQDLAGEYELTADITLSGEWLPIGNDGAPFTGKLNGNGHTIKGLVVTQKAWSGLFGNASGATISNLKIVGAQVGSDGDHVGIVAGRISGGGVIENVFTSGYVTGYDHIGGIAGDAGDDSATIKNCMSTAHVYSTSYQGGGIAGWTKGTVTISDNIFLGKVFVGAWGGAGGIVGFYEDGTLTLNGNVSAGPEIKGQYMAYPESGNLYDNARYSHGIVGGPYNENSILVASDNLVSEATKIINKDNGEEVDKTTLDETHNGIITSVADLKKASTYSSLGWGSQWSLSDGRYPVLAGMTVPFDGDYIYFELADKLYTGNVVSTKAVSSLNRDVVLTSSNPNVIKVNGTSLEMVGPGSATVTFTTAGDGYISGTSRSMTVTVESLSNEIKTAADIENLRLNPQGDFKLTADIDMAGVEFTPIVNFSGSIDGQGHFIKNLRFENKDADQAAFIGTFDGTSIKNLGFSGAYIIGNANTAALVGKTESPSTISGIVVIDSYIQGRDHVASFIGNLDGGATLSNSYSNAVLETRQFQLGAFAGVTNHGTIDKCVFSGTLAGLGGNTNIGMVGLLDSDGNPSKISNSLLAAAFLNSSSIADNIISLAGRQMEFASNYVIDYMLRDGVAASGSDANSAQGATVSKDQARTQAWYAQTLGFDFSKDWKFIPGTEGHMLPVPAWLNAPLNTVLFALPDEEGINNPYIAGTEKYDYSGIHGSWGEDITVEQIDGEDYACVVPEENAIYAGDENGEFKGAGTANFKVSIDPALSSVLKLTGRDTFSMNVYMTGDAKVISTAAEFLSIAKAPGMNYELAADIDLAGVDFNGFFNNSGSFTGTLDGKGHTVKNFRLTFTDGSDKGLFGKVTGATIKNIAFTNFVIDGGTTTKHVGLIGTGSATLEQVAVVGRAVGDDHVGLIAGDSDGITIKDSYAKGVVVGGSQAGGFFGCTLDGGATIENCLSNVDVSLSYRGWAGGFIGLIDKANSTVTIKNCASIGNATVTGNGNPKYAAPFIAGNGAGDNPNAVIYFSGNIYNSDATMVGEDGTDWPAKKETAEGGVVEAATAANPNQMQQQSTYTGISWDFGSVWAMGAGEYKYPVLKGVNVPDATLMADNSAVEGIEADEAENVVVYAAGGELHVATAAEATVAVYAINGVAVATATVEGAATFELPAAGVYVVSVMTESGKKTFKVLSK